MRTFKIKCAWHEGLLVNKKQEDWQHGTRKSDCVAQSLLASIENMLALPLHTTWEQESAFPTLQRTHLPLGLTSGQLSFLTSPPEIQKLNPAHAKFGLLKIIGESAAG